jgi:hypothetical protein
LTAKRLNGLLNHPSRQATPTRMCSCHHLPRIIGEQQWQAVGHNDGASQVCLLGHARICQRGMGRGCGELNHIHTVDLL